MTPRRKPVRVSGRPPLPDLIVRGMEIAVISAVLVLLTAAVLRFVGRDRFPVTSVIFYPFSWPVQMGGWVLLSLVVVRRRVLSAVCLTLAVGALLGWVRQDTGFRRPMPAAQAESVTLLFWNIDRPGELPEAASGLLRRFDPDIAVFAEAGDLTAAAREGLTREFPERDQQLLDGDLLLLTRRPANRLLSRELPNRTHFHALDVTHGDQSWHLGLADFGSMPPHPRTARLDAIRKLIANRPRTLIAGDFNTPLEAVGFDAWREEFHHGLADCVAYNGGFETWPHGIPMLSIDHIWMSRDLVPVAAEKGYIAGQDHAWLFVRARIAG